MKQAFTIILAALLAFSFTGVHAQEQKMDKKNLVIKEWNSDVRSNVRILDHTTTFNPEGKKIEEVEYNSDGTKKWIKRFEYGADGKLAKEVLYDGRGRVTTIKKFDFNEYGRKKTQYNYNAKGKLLSIKTYEYSYQDAE